MSKINLWTQLLGGHAVTASGLSFIFMSISIWREGGQLDKYRPNRRCHMPHFLLQSKRMKGFSFFFPFWCVWAPEECFKEIPPGEDNKHGSVSCVCGRSAVGSR